MNTNDKEMLELLRKRFEEGEISEKVYHELKEKLETPKTTRVRPPKKKKVHTYRHEPFDTREFADSLKRGLEPLKNLKVKIAKAEHTVDSIGDIISESLKPLEHLGSIIAESVGTALSSTFGTVQFDEEMVKVMGGADIHDDIKTKKVVVAGGADFFGTVEADYIKIAGSSEFHKDVIVNEGMKVAGSADFHGNIKGSGEVSFSGSSDVHGEIQIEGDLRITGSEVLHQSISAKSVYLTGSFECKGDLTAKDTIEIKISESTKIEGNITGSTILIRPRRDRRSLLETEDITGDTVKLKGVICRNIKAKDLRIGPGCKVSGKVTYSSSCEVDPTAELESQPVQE